MELTLKDPALLAAALRSALGGESLSLRPVDRIPEGEKTLVLSEADLGDFDSLKKAVEDYCALRETPWAVRTPVAEFLVRPACRSGRMAGKTVLITGGAQGFGKGIAEAFAQQGAFVAVADLNYDGAKAVADAIGGIPLSVNVAEEESVIRMVRETALAFGGIDILINNAGIVRSGPLEEMTKKDFELVTSVNYTAYFLCAKYVSSVMKVQHAFAPDKFFDIVQINSKSGLSGSNKNFAYAGSKFGGIGLTKSFAMELAPYRIKVNAVCPGNFLEGPLWNDPEEGLFVQYLRAGKIPGAQNIDDVRRYYEGLVPLNRGCRILDVVRAVFYACEQEYETGQAIPVTGGQNMLN